MGPLLLPHPRVDVSLADYGRALGVPHALEPRECLTFRLVISIQLME